MEEAETPRSGGWRTLVVVAACALGTLVAGDLAIRQVSPLPPKLLEVVDGMRVLEREDPDVAVIGSSHTRSFVPIRDRAKEAGGRTLALVTVEWGTMGSYLWVLQNRVGPLLERSKNLRDVIMVTTFFDLCDTSTVGSRNNLPARAWLAEHFLADAALNGLTPFNRNYLQRRWNRWWTGSVLVQGRGYNRVLDDLSDVVKPKAADDVKARRQRAVSLMRDELDARHDTCFAKPEREAFEALLKWAQGLGLRITVIHFPLVPGAVSPEFRRTTLKRYSDWMREVATRYPLRYHEMAVGSPLTDDDFMNDMDHATLEGNEKFADWALAGDLGWLLTPPEGPRK